MKYFILFIIISLSSFVTELYTYFCLENFGFNNISVVCLRIVLYILCWATLLAMLAKKTKTNRENLFIFINMLFVILVALFMAIELFLTGFKENNNPIAYRFMKNKDIIAASVDQKIRDMFPNVSDNTKNSETTVRPEELPVSSTNQNGIYEIQPNGMEYLSGLSKEEIYNLRTSFVQKSIFANPNYVPSDEVFGQIESGKPWRGMLTEICGIEGEPAEVNGLSEESRFMANPEALVMPVIVYGKRVSKEKFYKTSICFAPALRFEPGRIVYDANNRHITVHFASSKYLLKERYKYPFMFSGMNARDLGFPFVNIKSTDNIELTSSEVADNVYEFQDFIHVGGSCGVEGGCNNGSPMQNALLFYVTDTPASVEFKLWRNMPQSIEDAPDILYTLVFDERKDINGQ